MSISKAQALGIVFRSADTYAQELENRNLLFICVDKRGWKLTAAGPDGRTVPSSSS